MVAALMRKLDRETAAYFSFLLSTPAICGAVLLQLKDVVTGEVEQLSVFFLFVATFSSALFGYVAVKWMINYLKHHSLKTFAIYVWILGAVVLICQFTGVF